MSSDMDTKYNEAHVSLTLGPSRRLAAFIVAAALATLALLAFMPGAVWARAATGAWCIAAACHALVRARRPRAIRIGGGTAVCVDDTAGELARGSFVAPWLTVVHWVPAGARFPRTVVILPDMADARALRALRVVLRWGLP